MEIKRKSVAFNIADEDQKQLYIFATKTTNFSNYIKRLIERDMLRKEKA